MDKPVRFSLKLAAVAAAVGVTARQMTYAQEFRARLKAIEARAQAIDSSWAELARITGFARATPGRWMRRVPKTIQMIDQYEAALAKLERKARDKVA